MGLTMTGVMCGGLQVMGRVGAGRVRMICDRYNDVRGWVVTVMRDDDRCDGCDDDLRCVCNVGYV